MGKVITKKQKWGMILSSLTFLLGSVLMVYMIKVENEPGALPLILMLVGIVWFCISLYQPKKQLRKTN